jgi:phenylacetate-CoA ligase
VAGATRHDGWLAGLGVRAIIVAGEPGGSISATRQLIEHRWGARVIDHHGLTEVGPVSFECWERPGGLHVNEAEFVAEVIDPASAAPVPDGTMGELVLTNLGRTASPVLRYRTGDLVVRRRGVCACGRTLAWLDGGILARADDMVTVRGVNVYPAAIEAVLRQIAGIAEFRSTVAREGAMRTLSIEIELEPSAAAPDAVRERAARELQQALGLTVPVRDVHAGTLPRFEMKARRVVIAE